MNNFIIVFCEGDHDIAFLTRILLVNGYKSYNKKVNEFRKPLDKLYIKNLSTKKIADHEFKFQQPKQKVPYSVLEKDDYLVIFHNFNGDGNFKKDGANNIIKMYLSLNNENRRKIEKYEKLNYKFLYFLDADNEGVESRVNAIKNSLDLDEFKHLEITSHDNYDVGCYIFHDEKDLNKYGTLEDVLISLMMKNNETTFNNSRDFIKSNLLASDRQRKLLCTDIEEKPVDSITFKKQKSIISIAGQLQFSGSSNAVIIANSDYIKKNDIDNSTSCQNILKLFNR